MGLVNYPLIWERAALQDIMVHIIGGDWGKEPEYLDEGYLSVFCIRGSEFKDWNNNFGKTAVERKIKSSSLEKRELVDGDILVEISGGGPEQPVGRTVLIEKKVLKQLCLPVVGTNFLRLMRPLHYVSSSFVNRYLEFFYKSGEVVKYQGGSNNLRNLKFKEYSAIEIPVPSALEQKIIADKLDTLLAQVDSAKARLEQIPQILKRFRQAVLASAVSRRLIPKDQKSNVRFDVSVGSLCITSFDGPFGSKLKTDDYTNTGVRVARLENIGHLTFNDEKETYISDTKFNSLKGNKIEKDDVLFSSFVDEDVRVCLFPHNDKIFINKADCFCLRINQEKASPKYVALTLASRTSYEQIKAQVQGVTRPRINLKTLRSLSFPFPSLQEQNEIVRRVEQLFAYADGIEKQVQNALECVNNLTQSILAKAFRGELTAQWRAENPDLISGENSAQELLAKIQQQRKSTKTIKRSKGNS